MHSKALLNQHATEAAAAAAAAAAAVCRMVVLNAFKGFIESYVLKICFEIG